MNEKLSLLHRAVLWLSVFPTILFGLGYYFAPKWMSNALDAPTTDPSLLHYIGGFLLGSVVGAGLSLRSDKWSEVRIVTLYLMTWNILNSAAMFYGLSAKAIPSAYLPNAILTAVAGIGFLVVVIQRRAA